MFVSAKQTAIYVYNNIFHAKTPRQQKLKLLNKQEAIYKSSFHGEWLNLCRTPKFTKVTRKVKISLQHSPSVCVSLFSLSKMREKWRLV